MKEESVQQGKAYERVISYIKGEILKGDLKQGEKLPPERELAEQLGVGRNSVREALRTLSLMGFISSTQGAGLGEPDRAAGGRAGQPRAAQRAGGYRLAAPG